MTVESIQKHLQELRDEAYKQFHSKLIPGVPPEMILGVRTPAMRKFAKELVKAGETEEFLRALPHTYYDENVLHGCILSLGKDYEKTVEEVERFLPYVDNWAVCDLLSPKVFKKHTKELLPHIENWLASDHTYTIRFGMGMLLTFYLDEEFDPAYPAMVAQVKSDEYYVKMMAAWYFATALAKQYDAVIGYLLDGKLEEWTHNKTIQKAIESYRITDERKAYLRTLKIR